jgi:hypothetical protein
MAGRGSMVLAGVFAGLFLVAQVMVASGERGGERFSDNLMLAIPMIGAGMAAVGAGVLAALGIVRGERSPIVYAIATIGLIVFSSRRASCWSRIDERRAGWLHESGSGLVSPSVRSPLRSPVTSLGDPGCCGGAQPIKRPPKRCRG